VGRAFVDLQILARAPWVGLFEFLGAHATSVARQVLRVCAGP
jgi:hypothetical protein